MTAGTIYGVRGPDPRNTVVKAGPRREDAEEMLLDEDVIVVSTDGGQTWHEVIR
ncbi:MAG: hypothetical protein JWO67_4021 [Streptosporangiaceae bacterium]|nr:hypothetical protein [Streptosporangiaceae bacterium]